MGCLSSIIISKKQDMPRAIRMFPAGVGLLNIYIYTYAVRRPGFEFVLLVKQHLQQVMIYGHFGIKAVITSGPPQGGVL